MSEQEDPRARFRELPARVRPDELVETADAGSPQVTDSPVEDEWRSTLLGPNAG